MTRIKTFAASLAVALLIAVPASRVSAGATYDLDIRPRGQFIEVTTCNGAVFVFRSLNSTSTSPLLVYDDQDQLVMATTKLHIESDGNGFLVITNMDAGTQPLASKKNRVGFNSGQGTVNTGTVST